MFPFVSHAIAAAKEPIIDDINNDLVAINERVEYANNASPAPTGSISLSANESNEYPL